MFWQKFVNIAIDSHLAVKDSLQNGSSPRNNKAFQLVGYDFLIDEDLRVWLIEVNDHPYIGVPNQYIAKALPIMLDDMFDIVLDDRYDPGSNQF